MVHRNKCLARFSLLLTHQRCFCKAHVKSFKESPTWGPFANEKRSEIDLKTPILGPTLYSKSVVKLKMQVGFGLTSGLLVMMMIRLKFQTDMLLICFESISWQKAVQGWYDQRLVYTKEFEILEPKPIKLHTRVGQTCDSDQLCELTTWSWSLLIIFLHHPTSTTTVRSAISNVALYLICWKFETTFDSKYELDKAKTNITVESMSP